MKLDTIYRTFRTVWIAVIVATLAACTDEEIFGTYGEEGRPIELKLNFKATAPEVVVSSRALNEYAVRDLYVFIFNANTGELRARQFYDEKDLTNNTTGYQSDTKGTDNWVKIKTTTGNSRIYAIANVQASVNIYGDVVDAPKDQKKDLKTQLDRITTEEGLRTLQLNIRPSVNRLSDFLVMAGAVNNGEVYTIKEGEDINNKEDDPILLRRLDSEINFNFEAGGEGTNCTSFEVTSYQVFNVPNKTYVLGRDNNNKNLKEYYIETDHDELDAATTYSEEEGETTDFFHTEAVPTASNSFTFYMAENRKQAKTGEGTGIVDYNDRELEIKASDEDKENDENEGNEKTSVRRTYVNAPDNGTYVLVTGKFFGYSDKYVNDTDNKQYSGEAEANVRYIIHLGGEDPEVANQMDFDNFDIFRNSKYTYNVTVKGVNDIVVEVVEEKENAPGAEGEVLFVNGSQKYILDAHYETVLLAFNKTQLQTGNKNASEFFTYQIKTPYASYTSTYNNTYEGAKDEDWIRIVRNEKGNDDRYSKAFRKYRDVENPEDYLTVEKFINELQGLTDKDFDSNDTIVYTCHINEFYYQDNPVENGKKASWKEFVNQPNRELHILNQVKDSKDELSSIVSSAYIISQRSIQTFYATDITDSYSAYGVETINETGALANYEHYHDQIDQWSNTDWDNGLGNFKTILGCDKILESSKSWETYVDWTKNGYVKSNLQESPLVKAMKGDYERAYLACMQRNRDLDGNGTISDDEIRWYLPAQNQYVGMFLGESGLSPESRLYPYNEQGYKHIHYVSSTVYDDKGNNSYDYAYDDKNNNGQLDEGELIEYGGDGLVVYWAEEAVSTSHAGQDGIWTMNHDRPNHQYRCMRNLYDGMEYDKDNTSAPKDFYVVSANTTDGIAGYNITVPYLNKASLRTELIGFGDLGIHSDDDPIKSRVATGGFYTGEKIDANYGNYKIAYANEAERIYRIQYRDGGNTQLEIVGPDNNADYNVWDLDEDGEITVGFWRQDEKDRALEDLQKVINGDKYVGYKEQAEAIMAVVENWDVGKGDFDAAKNFLFVYDPDGINGIKKLIFNYCDTNKDGKLDAGDINFKRIMIDGPGFEDLWDMNMDGMITGGIYSYGDWNGDTYQNIKDFEEQYGYEGDINSESTYGKFFSPNGPCGIDNDIFDQCDINGDGKLTEEDIMNLYTITGLNKIGQATNYQTPCYYIKDENGNYGKWRVPNLRELYLMLVAENDVDNGKKGIITGGEVSRTQFRFKDIKCDDSNNKRFGWYTNGKEKLTMNPELDTPWDKGIEGRYQDVKIRCIRDNNAPAISALSE